MNGLFNHLWQSTVFAGAVAIGGVILRRHSPRLRYWLWLAASLKFLIPFSLLVSTGAHVQLPPRAPALRGAMIQRVSSVFEPGVVFQLPLSPSTTPISWTPVLAAVWFAGSLYLAIRWFRNWRLIDRAAHRARPIDHPWQIPVFASASQLEPGVFGIVRPILLLPKNLRGELSDEQFDAILAHESRHIQFHDNLTAALHMVVETLFWFHPLIWWIGARLTDERERDCDAAALQHGSSPADYARGIVSVCQNFTESPLLCASGISGADLKKRIHEIMTWRESLPLSVSGKAALTATALAAVSIPFAIGILRAQTDIATASYDVASIHASDPAERSTHMGSDGPRGGLRTHNVTVLQLIAAAYHVQDYQVLNTPSWAASERFDVVVTPDGPEAIPEAAQGWEKLWDVNLLRLRSVLRDRFHLTLKPDTRQMPIYVLAAGPKNNKLSPPTGQPSIQTNGDREITATSATMEMLASQLSWQLRQPVKDETGLAGRFDLKFDWVPDPDLPNGPIVTAVNEQLGLRMSAAKGDVPVYVIERLDHPSEN